MNRFNRISRIVIAFSALLLVSAYFVPLWQILMWAPQYPEGLEMKIWINNLTGNVKIISALNHYIGMRTIEVSMFPEFQYMGYMVGFLIGFGLMTAWANKRFFLWTYAGLIFCAGIGALVDFYLWGYEYGHNLDPTAPIIVPGMSYQPPLIGTKQLLNFTAYSGPDIGAWFFMASGVMVLIVMIFELRKKKYYNAKGAIESRPLSVSKGGQGLHARRGAFSTLVIIVTLLFLNSCAIEPQPLLYNKDACHTCKMILMDKRFGAEVITKKGKVFKFDDSNCMINFLNSEEIKKDETAFTLIVDFAQPGKLMPAAQSFFLKSDEVHSPMNGGVAAFATEQVMKEYKKKWNAIYLGWGEMQVEYK